MKIKIKLIIAALLSLGSVIAENVIHDDTLLITEKERVNGLDHYGVASLVGQDGKLGHPAFTNFEYVLGSPISITGDLDTVNWGIACVDTKDKYENSCIVRDDKEYQDYHYANEYTYKQADVYLKSSFDAVLEMSKVSKLPIRVVTGGQKWAGGSMGQFGLSPNGDYIKYNRDLFDIDTSLTLFYSIKDKTKNNEDLSFNTAIVVNANIEKDKIALKEKMDKESDFWTILTHQRKGNLAFCHLFLKKIMKILGKKG